MILSLYNNNNCSSFRIWRLALP